MTLLLTVPEAAAELRLHRATVYRLIAEGALPVVRVTRRGVRINRDALNEYVKSQTDPAFRRIS